MSSVTERIKEVHQPRGGYINPKLFSCVHLKDQGEVKDHTLENIHATKAGLIVDYMTRLMCGTAKDEAFKISLSGANIACENGFPKAKEIAEELLDSINGVDDDSLRQAYRLVGYDVWYRKTEYAINLFNTPRTEFKEPTIPDEITLDNLRSMIANGVAFFNQYGPVTSDGFTFENPSITEKELELFKNGVGCNGGYTATVNTGDGDFLTKYTLWDFKVSVKGPTSLHSLQLMMYYIMGLHSGQEKYKTIENIGIYNPRLNNVYLYSLSNVPKDVIITIEKDVICY